jgi:homoserine kinase
MKNWEKEFKSFQVLVPGSISNLGCGFDTLGLAVSLYFKTSIHSSQSFAFESHCNGKSLDFPESENLFLRVLRSCYPISPDDWRFTVSIDTEIPPKKGLGSLCLRYDQRTACSGQVDEFASETSRSCIRLSNGNHTRITCALRSWEGLRRPCRMIPARYITGNWPFQESQGAVADSEWEVSTEEAREIAASTVSTASGDWQSSTPGIFSRMSSGWKIERVEESVRDQVHQPYRAPLMPFARDLPGYGQISCRFRSDDQQFRSGFRRVISQP